MYASTASSCTILQVGQMSDKLFLLFSDLAYCRLAQYRLRCRGTRLRHLLSRSSATRLVLGRRRRHRQPEIMVLVVDVDVCRSRRRIGANRRQTWPTTVDRRQRWFARLVERFVSTQKGEKKTQVTTPVDREIQCMHLKCLLIVNRLRIDCLLLLQIRVLVGFLTSSTLI